MFVAREVSTAVVLFVGRQVNFLPEYISFPLYMRGLS